MTKLSQAIAMRLRHPTKSNRQIAYWSRGKGQAPSIRTVKRANRLVERFKDIEPTPRTRKGQQALATKFEDLSTRKDVIYRTVWGVKSDNPNYRGNPRNLMTIYSREPLSEEQALERARDAARDARHSSRGGARNLMEHLDRPNTHEFVSHNRVVFGKVLPDDQVILKAHGQTYEFQGGSWVRA